MWWTIPHLDIYFSVTGTGTCSPQSYTSLHINSLIGNARFHSCSNNQMLMLLAISHWHLIILHYFLWWLPFNQIGDSVPQLFRSTQDVGIFISTFPLIGRYQLLRNIESQSFSDLSLQVFDRSPDIGRVRRFFSSQGSKWNRVLSGIHLPSQKRQNGIDHSEINPDFRIMRNQETNAEKKL